MTHDNQPGQRRGFFASLSAALSPAPIPEDDTGPLTAPKGVIAAAVLTILASLAYILSGGLGVATIGQMVEQSKEQYRVWIADCTRDFGGIGTAITEADPTGSAAACQGLTEMTAETWESFRTASIVVSSIFLAMGLGLLAAGIFLRKGRRWARRVIVGVAIVTVAAAMLLGMSSPIILGATLILMIAVVLCYLSTGATFFIRAADRKHR